MPDLAIMLLTYNRLAYAVTTIRSVLKNVKYTRGDIHVHIAFDGDTETYQKRMLEQAVAGLMGRKIPEHRFHPVSSSNSGRHGYGANYNLATQVIHANPEVKYVLPLEDDWECIRELDADHFTRVLDNGVIGCIRLGYIGFTQVLNGSFVSADDALFVGLDPHSPEPHVFAGHPRIETVDWERTVGPWEEGLGAGATEFEVCHRYEARRGVAWPMEVDPRPGYGLFAHIGSERAEDVV